MTDLVYRRGVILGGIAFILTMGTEPYHN